MSPAGEIGADAPGDRDVAYRHPDLPALGVLLDPDALEAFLSARLGDSFCADGYDLDRVRLKPNTSVGAALRPRAGSGSWLLARAFAPQPWPSKSGKERRIADAHGWPVVADSRLRLVVVPAAADIRLPGLAGLRPDDDTLVPADIIGEDAVPGRVYRARTLSYNPARRWVGRLDPVLDVSGGERQDPADPLLVRVHAEGAREALAWTSGRPWRDGDPLPDVASLAAARVARAAHLDHVPPADPTASLRASLEAAAQGLAAIHPPFAHRARRVVATLAPLLPGVPLLPAHGDFSPDQVVVDDDGRPHVLDWDRAGWWPAGWDDATWWVSRLSTRLPSTARTEASGRSAPRDAAAPVPEVVAAAAVLRTPEPFRRRRPAWGAVTDALLRTAEDATGLGS